MTVPTFTVSKQRNGSLLLDGIEFNTQQQNVRIVPPERGDEANEEVLSGDVLPPEDEGAASWTLAITAVQDFTNATGFQKFTWDNHGQTVPFTWKPTGAAGPTFAGTVTVWSTDIGGPMNRRLQSEIEWSVPEKPTWTPAV